MPAVRNTGAKKKEIIVISDDEPDPPTVAVSDGTRPFV